MACPYCYTYVYDTIQSAKLPKSYHPRALRKAHLLVPELIRIARGEEGSLDYAALVFLEAGGVRNTFVARDPMCMADLWVRAQLNAIAFLSEIHDQHSPPPLRIRIPRTLYIDETPPLLRIRIPA